MHLLAHLDHQRLSRLVGACHRRTLLFIGATLAEQRPTALATRRPQRLPVGLCRTQLLLQRRLAPAQLRHLPVQLRHLPLERANLTCQRRRAHLDVRARPRLFRPLDLKRACLALRLTQGTRHHRRIHQCLPRPPVLGALRPRRERGRRGANADRACSGGGPRSSGRRSGGRHSGSGGRHSGSGGRFGRRMGREGLRLGRCRHERCKGTFLVLLRNFVVDRLERRGHLAGGALVDAGKEVAGGTGCRRRRPHRGSHRRANSRRGGLEGWRG